MPEKSMDKRSLRSRKALQDALVALLKTQPLDKITVTDVINKAGYSRTAFYNNYLDVEDCLTAVMEEQAALLYDSFRDRSAYSVEKTGPIVTDQGNAHELVFTAPYRTVYNNKDFYLALANLDREWYYRLLSIVTSKFYSNADYVVCGTDEAVDPELWMWSHVCDTLSRIAYWIAKGMIYSPEYMGRQQYLKRLTNVYLLPKGPK